MANNKYFKYENNELKVENVSVKEIIKDVGTPTYIYSSSCMLEQLNNLKVELEGVPSIICYAMKGCNNNNILKLFTNENCGFDIVSGGELYKALKVGANPSKIVYSGVGKTRRELIEAINANILMINVESEAEVERINNLATSLNKKVRIAIRVNPGVDAQTHPYITTGLRENKFGIDKDNILSLFIHASKLSNIEVVGIDCHIGSQLLNIEPYEDAMKIISDYVEQLHKLGIKIKYIDVGGGLGIPYKGDENNISVKDYVKYVTKPFEKFNDIVFVFEPGRYLTAQSGVLVAEVQYIKENSYGKKFVIVDTGMHHMMRPILYGGYHEIIPVKKGSGEKEKVDVVGPICESTDFLAKDRLMDKVVQDDLIAITNAGAYGIVLGSHYNLHSLPVEVLVFDKGYKIIKIRETYEDITKNEVW